MAETALRRARPLVLGPVRLSLRIAPLAAAFLAAVLLALIFGTYLIAPGQIAGIVLHHLNLWPARVGWSATTDAIVWQIRLPHVLAAALAGAALALAGALFQAVLRNPLADPYVIGTSAGAQLGVTAAFFLPLGGTLLGFGPVQVAAFVGALVTVMAVYFLARTGGTVPVVTLILAGFVVSSFLISATTFLTFLGPDVGDRLTQVLAWTLGGVEVDEWSQLALTAPLVLLGCLAAIPLAHSLDLLLLGERQAGHLGLGVERVKLLTIILASLLTALAVTLAGVVAFVGLVVPHALRLVYGPGHRFLLPAAAIMGATFVVLCDLAARVVIAPAEAPLGVITALLGAPLFLHLLRRSRRAYSL